MPPNRCIIYIKDICRITGKTERQARTLLSCIKRKCGKEKHQLVSVSDFCSYTGLDPKEISPYL